jgi:hypothetical protein
MIAPERVFNVLIIKREMLDARIRLLCAKQVPNVNILQTISTALLYYLSTHPLFLYLLLLGKRIKG